MSSGPARTLDLAGRVPALDGLRGIAVGLVVLSHFRTVVSSDPNFYEVTPWTWINQALSRGFLGVDLFFVISGFLITSLLLRTVDLPPSRRLKNFYARRALRLLPPLVVLLSASAIIAAWEGFPWEKQWRTTWRALLFVSNVDPAGVFLRAQDDLGHLWSLAVEEQFYLIWPVLVIGLGLRRSGPRLQITVVLAVIAAVAIHRMNLWNDGLPWLFAYQRTDTRIDTILVGALAAIVYRTGRPSPQTSAALAAAGAVAILPVTYLYADTEAGFLYRGGFTLVAVLFGFIVLWSATGTAHRIGALTSGLLPAIGKVSYGLYLYHLPVFRIFERHVSVGSDWTRIGLATAISGAIAVLSSRFIEQPFLRLKDRRFSESSHGAP